VSAVRSERRLGLAFDGTPIVSSRRLRGTVRDGDDLMVLFASIGSSGRFRRGVVVTSMSNLAVSSPGGGEGRIEETDVGDRNVLCS